MTLGHLLMRSKDHIQENKMAGVVYQIPCAVYSATYVGQTGRCLNHQLKNMGMLWSRDRGDSANSALAEQTWSVNHAVDWDNSKILGHQRNLHQRLVRESIHIRA